MIHTSPLAAPASQTTSIHHNSTLASLEDLGVAAGGHALASVALTVLVAQCPKGHCNLTITHTLIGKGMVRGGGGRWREGDGGDGGFGTYPPTA